LFVLRFLSVSIEHKDLFSLYDITLYLNKCPLYLKKYTIESYIQ